DVDRGAFVRSHRPLADRHGFGGGGGHRRGVDVFLHGVSQNAWRGSGPAAERRSTPMSEEHADKRPQAIHTSPVRGHESDATSVRAVGFFLIALLASLVLVGGA